MTTPVLARPTNITTPQRRSGFVESALRFIIPYRLLAEARLLQLRITGHPDYFERTDRRVFFERAFCLVSKNKITGDYCEFGCHGGMTFIMASQAMSKYTAPQCQRRMWAFDSFSGLPPQSCAQDEHPAWRAGELCTAEESWHRIVRRAGVKDYKTVPGYYSDTIGRTATRPPAELPNDIAIAYIDCDLYSSTMSVLEFLAPRVKQGMVIACDDYHLLSTTAAAGERAAIMEFFPRELPQFVLIPYVQYGYAGMSFVVEERRHLGAGATVAV
jgi:O-methyltransferase